MDGSTQEKNRDYTLDEKNEKTLFKKIYTSFEFDTVPLVFFWSLSIPPPTIDSLVD